MNHFLQYEYIVSEDVPCTECKSIIPANTVGYKLEEDDKVQCSIGCFLEYTTDYTDN